MIRTMQIMIIDDSPVMRKIIRKSILQSGYGDADIVEAADGLQALDVLEVSNPALILSDWNMPEMTGLELLCKLRKTGNVTPFGFITTEFTEQMRTLADNSGATFLLSKPFNVVQLKAMLDPLLKAAP